MSDIFRLNTDQIIIGLDGKVAANAQVHFYDRKTGHYAPVYGDAGLIVSLRQPVHADSAGVLQNIYLDDAVSYRAVIADSHNNRIREIDEVRRERAGIKILGGVDALKHYCGEDPFVLVAAAGGCPGFYKRLSGCALPAEHLPDLVRAECGCNCHVAWQLCGGSEAKAPDLCAAETADLNCDYHVLVQECPQTANADGPAGRDTPETGCQCTEKPDAAGEAAVAAAAAPALKKASIGALLSAGAQCLPKTCIPHDAPELAIVNGALVQGERVPPPLDTSDLGGMWGNGIWGRCIMITVGETADPTYRHVRLDDLEDVLPGTDKRPIGAPEIKLTNAGSCPRRYEVRALNRLNRAHEHDPDYTRGQFIGPPVIDANFQTKLGRQGDPFLDHVLAPADFLGHLKWLTDLSIADSTMGPFNSGVCTDNNANDINKSANGYTENDLIVDLAPGESRIYTLKYHIYWDMTATDTDLKEAERIHFGTRIIARQVR